MIGHISNNGYIVKYYNSGSSLYATVFKDGRVKNIYAENLNILTIEEQIKEFNRYYFKYILPPDHLKNFVKSSPIKDEAKK